MKLLSDFWQNFREKPDVCFFYGFLITFTLSIRKIIYFYPIKGEFNEYSAISLYLSDIFLILTILTWIFSILQNKFNILSRFSPLIHSLSSPKQWIMCWKSLKCSTCLPAGRRGTFFTRWNILKNKLLIIPLLLVIWAFISIIWSENKILASYRSIKFLEFYLLYVYILYKLFHVEQSDRNCHSERSEESQTINERSLANAQDDSNCSTWNIWKNILIIFIFLGLFQSIIGIWQFIIQHSIGLFWLKESLISPDILGVAKIIIGSQKYIRAYGLFPHPNILGGFLLLSIILTLLYKRMFHVEHSLKGRHSERSEESQLISERSFANAQDDRIYLKFFRLNQNVPPRKNINCSTPAPFFENVPRGTFSKFTGWNNLDSRGKRGTFCWIILSIQIAALILTFSKSAILGLIIAILYIFINQKRSVPHLPGESEIVPVRKDLNCSTWNNLNPRAERGTISGFYGMEHLKRYFIISLFIFGFLLFYFKIDLYSLFIKSLDERLLYLPISIKAIMSHIFFGLGNGQFVLEMQKYALQSLEFWQFQPVHNVFLLILAELGIVGLFLFIWFLMELFANIPLARNASRSDAGGRGTLLGGRNISSGVEQLDNIDCHAEFISASQNKTRILKRVQNDIIGESILNNNTTNLSSIYLKALLLGFIFIMLFDHYFWDIQQGQLLLWLIFGLIIESNKNTI